MGCACPRGRCGSRLLVTRAGARHGSLRSCAAGPVRQRRLPGPCPPCAEAPGGAGGAGHARASLAPARPLEFLPRCSRCRGSGAHPVPGLDAAASVVPSRQGRAAETWRGAQGSRCWRHVVAVTVPSTHVLRNRPGLDQAWGGGGGGSVDADLSFCLSSLTRPVRGHPVLPPPAPPMPSRPVLPTRCPHGLHSPPWWPGRQRGAWGLWLFDSSLVCPTASFPSLLPVSPPTSAP